MSTKKGTRWGMAVLAFACATVTIIAALMLAASRAEDPLFPALIGGSGVLVALGLARWGMREVSLSSLPRR